MIRKKYLKTSKPGFTGLATGTFLTNPVKIFAK